MQCVLLLCQNIDLRGNKDSCSNRSNVTRKVKQKKKKHIVLRHLTHNLVAKKPNWNPSSLASKTILIHRDQEVSFRRHL